MKIILAKNIKTGKITTYSTQAEMFKSKEFIAYDKPANRARVSMLLGPKSIHNRFHDWQLKTKIIVLSDEHAQAIWDGEAPLDDDNKY